MWYREWLAMRRMLVIYGIVVAAIATLNAWGAGDDGGIYLTQATLLAAGATASILALIAGNGLGRERGTNARRALLRPIARERYAWTIFAVDIAALVLAYAGAAILIVGTYQAAHGFPRIDLRGASLLTCLILPLGAIVAFYGVAAVCSITTRGSWLAAALVGPIALVLYVGATAQVREVARCFQILCFLDPIIHFMAAVQRVEASAHPDAWSSHDNGFYGSLSPGADACILYAMAGLTLFVATVSWKRAEV